MFKRKFKYAELTQLKKIIKFNIIIYLYLRILLTNKCIGFIFLLIPLQSYANDYDDGYDAGYVRYGKFTR